jgi:hypothetical protein
MEMESELKRVVQPVLRADKFAGSFPHFRKVGEDSIDLVTFQFDRRGGGFIIEIARCPSDGILTYWGLRIPPNKTRAWDIHPDDRKRIKCRSGTGTDTWFRFDTAPVAEISAEVLRRLTADDLWKDVRVGGSAPSRGNIQSRN